MVNERTVASSTCVNSGKFFISPKPWDEGLFYWSRKKMMEAGRGLGSRRAGWYQKYVCSHHHNLHFCPPGYVHLCITCSLMPVMMSDDINWMHQYVLQVTKLPNGIPVASLENFSPLCRVAVVYNAGPRYEPIDKLGLTHCLRMASNLVSFHTLNLWYHFVTVQTAGSVKILIAYLLTA